MFPASFDESNGVLDANGYPDTDALCVWRGARAAGPRPEDGNVKMVISCWKPTAEELEEIQRTGRVWLIIQGETMPPAAVTGHTPFGE